MKHEGKVVCSGNGTHKRKRLGQYGADDDSFFMISTQPGTGMARYPGGTEHLTFRCPSCSGDWRFLAETFHSFLNADLPFMYRDVSTLGAIL